MSPSGRPEAAPFERATPAAWRAWCWPVLLATLLALGCAQRLIYDRRPGPVGHEAAVEDGRAEPSASPGQAGEPAGQGETGKRAGRGEAERTAARPVIKPSAWKGALVRWVTRRGKTEEARGEEKAEREAVEKAAASDEGEKAGESGGGFVLTRARSKWDRPFIANAKVGREVRKLPRSIFEKARAGALEGVACWRFTTRDGATWSADRWTLEAALADHVVLRERGKPAAHVVDAENLRWIESPTEFPVQVRERTVRARRVEVEPEKRRIVDVYGVVQEVPVGDAHYAPPRDAPPDVVFGIDADGNAWPLDLAVIRGFIERHETGVVVLGNYRTVPSADIVRWEFDKEWGPWSIVLAPYLAARWTFAGKEYVARCERFP